MNIVFMNANLKLPSPTTLCRLTVPEEPPWVSAYGIF